MTDDLLYTVDDIIEYTLANFDTDEISTLVDNIITLAANEHILEEFMELFNEDNLDDEYGERDARWIKIISSLLFFELVAE